MGMTGETVDLAAMATSAERAGALWTLEEGEDLNANLVRFDAGGGVGEHVNGEVDVLFVGIAGAGFVRVDGEERPVSEGRLVFAPKGASRSTRAASGGFAYLTVHRRRGPLRFGGRDGRTP